MTLIRAIQSIGNQIPILISKISVHRNYKANILRSEQNGHHLVHNICKSFYWIKILYFNKISMKFVCMGPLDYMSALVLFNGLILYRQQAITWTNTGHVTWCYMVSMGYNELRHFKCTAIHCNNSSSTFSYLIMRTKFKTNPRSLSAYDYFIWSHLKLI